jgi:hypothetical protein
MDQDRPLVQLSALPLALVAVGAVSIALLNIGSGRDDAIVWLAVGVAAVASAIGVARGMRWAFVVEAVIGLILVLGVLFITLFSLAMVTSTGAGLDGNMLGTPFGILNGWASLVLYAVTFAAALWMLIASVLGRRAT